MSEQPLAHGHTGVSVQNQVLRKAYLLLAFSFIPCGIGAFFGSNINPMAMPNPASPPTGSQYQCRLTEGKTSSSANKAKPLLSQSISAELGTQNTNNNQLNTNKITIIPSSSVTGLIIVIINNKSKLFFLLDPTS